MSDLERALDAITKAYALLQNDDTTGAAAHLPAGGVECERLVDEALDILRPFVAKLFDAEPVGLIYDPA